MRIAALFLPALLGMCQPDETISGYAPRGVTWQLDSIGDQPFAAKATLVLPDEGKVLGTGPCNSFRASQTAPYPWIEIRDIAATRRACPDLEAEHRYFEALARMSLAEVSPNVLLLTAEDGTEMVFRLSPR